MNNCLIDILSLAKSAKPRPLTGDRKTRIDDKMSNIFGVTIVSGRDFAGAFCLNKTMVGCVKRGNEKQEDKVALMRVRGMKKKLCTK